MILTLMDALHHDKLRSLSARKRRTASSATELRLTD